MYNNHVHQVTVAQVQQVVRKYFVADLQAVLKRHCESEAVAADPLALLANVPPWTHWGENQDAPVLRTAAQRAADERTKQSADHRLRNQQNK